MSQKARKTSTIKSKNMTSPSAKKVVKKSDMATVSRGIEENSSDLNNLNNSNNNSNSKNNNKVEINKGTGSTDRIGGSSFYPVYTVRNAEVVGGGARSFHNATETETLQESVNGSGAVSPETQNEIVVSPDIHYDPDVSESQTHDKTSPQKSHMSGNADEDLKKTQSPGKENHSSSAAAINTSSKTLYESSSGKESNASSKTETQTSSVTTNKTSSKTKSETSPHVSSNKASSRPQSKIPPQTVSISSPKTSSKTSLDNANDVLSSKNHGIVSTYNQNTGNSCTGNGKNSVKESGNNSTKENGKNSSTASGKDSSTENDKYSSTEKGKNSSAENDKNSWTEHDTMIDDIHTLHEDDGHPEPPPCPANTPESGVVDISIRSSIVSSQIDDMTSPPPRPSSSSSVSSPRRSHYVKDDERSCYNLWTSSNDEDDDEKENENEEQEDIDGGEKRIGKNRALRKKTRSREARRTWRAAVKRASTKGGVKKGVKDSSNNSGRSRIPPVFLLPPPGRRYEDYFTIKECDEIELGKKPRWIVPRLKYIMAEMGCGTSSQVVSVEEKLPVVVFGATGVLGGSVVRALLKDPRFSVRAVTRTPTTDQARALAEEGAVVVPADLNDVRSLQRVMDGVAGVFLTTNFWEHLSKQKELTQGMNAVDAAVSCNVHHFIFQGSEHTKDDGKPCGHMNAKAAIEEYVKETHLAYTSIHMPFLYENLLSLFKPHCVEPGLYTLPIPMGDKPMDCMSLHDFGRCVVSIFLRPKNHMQKSVELTGDRMTVQHMVDVLNRHFDDRKFVHHKMTPDDFSQFDFQGCQDLAAMFQYLQSAPTRDPRITRRIHQSVVCFDRWVNDNRQSLLDAMKDAGESAS